MYFPSAYFRAKARAALKGHWQTALLIALIVSLPSLLIHAINIYTGIDPTIRFNDFYNNAVKTGILTQQLLMTEMESYLRSSWFWTAVGLNAAAWLVTPCLTLGMYCWMLNRLRGQADQPVSTVFCRARLFFKAIGLQLLVALKVILWMLPGMVMTAGAYVPLLRAGRDPAAAASAINLSNGLMLPAMLLMAVLGIMAALRYAMSDFILADEPETGILECIRRSKQHMREMKHMLLFLLLVFYLWLLLSIFVFSSISVIGRFCQMLVQIFITVYESMSVTAFFLETAPRKIPKRENRPDSGEGGADPGPDPLN